MPKTWGHPIVCHLLLPVQKVTWQLWAAPWDVALQRCCLD